MKRCYATRGIWGALTRRLKPTATIETSRSEGRYAAERQVMVASIPAIMRRGLKPPATVETSRSEAQDAAERQLTVARPFKAGKEGMGVDVATVDLCREGDAPATTRRGLKPPATIETSRSEAQDVAERRLMVARPFKAGKENPQTPSSRSDERYTQTIARNVAEVLEA